MQTSLDRPRRRILLVEDDRSHRWLLRRVLESFLGNEVVIEEVESGQDALARLAQRTDVDLMLLDLNLPDISGFQVLERLRGELNLRALPVVVLSSSQEKEDIRRAYE